LFYIGLALYSEAWSENDVVELADELRQTSDFDVVPLIASNLVAGTYPVADDATIASLVNTAAERARPDDIVLVHVSTHGGPGVLARKFGNRRPTVITARQLAAQLEPLTGQHTVLILSACYSGSLIRPLASSQRIIITAARADRSSFGCDPGNRHTLFGEAELQAFSAENSSLRQVFAAIRGDVARMERRENYEPSNPQISVGSAMKDIYDDPLF
jgi:hypothetical protein